MILILVFAVVAAQVGFSDVDSVEFVQSGYLLQATLSHDAALNITLVSPADAGQFASFRMPNSASAFEVLFALSCCWPVLAWFRFEHLDPFRRSGL